MNFVSMLGSLNFFIKLFLIRRTIRRQLSSSPIKIRSNIVCILDPPFSPFNVPKVDHPYFLLASSSIMERMLTLSGKENACTKVLLGCLSFEKKEFNLVLCRLSHLFSILSSIFRRSIGTKFEMSHWYDLLFEQVNKFRV